VIFAPLKPNMLRGAKLSPEGGLAFGIGELEHDSLTAWLNVAFFSRDSAKE
jgi:hypothetical protein